ncbi:hypothetical protein B0H14DRAFT_3138325 [Mycena olivaceomarginata]|nr:hypothetical protein B0H14DRAFT_3138325 [Mycena olivaceomarginata]
MINLGPSLAAQLTGILQHEGEAALVQKFPELAPLVTHVVDYVGEYKVQYEQAAAARKRVSAGNKKAGRHKKRRVGDPVSADVEPESEDRPVASEPAKDWRIPADLFGLLPDAKGPPFSLKALTAAAARIKDDDHLYGTATDSLCSVWDQQLILKPMAIFDRFINPNDHKTKTKDSGDVIRDRCITRGAILHSLSHFFGDGIFCASAMQVFWQRPCVIFPPKISRDRHFARAIERDKTDTLKVLDNYLWQLLAENPKLSDVCMRMGELVHRGLLSVTTGFTLTDEQYEHPLKWIALDIPMSLLAARPGKGRRRKQNQVIDLVPTLESLLPSKPEFSAAAILIREAVSRKRGHAATDDTRIFQRMLDALHPTQQKRTQINIHAVIRGAVVKISGIGRRMPFHFRILGKWLKKIQGWRAGEIRVRVNSIGGRRIISLSRDRGEGWADGIKRD